MKNNLEQVDSLNQRGGRMLSIVDLIHKKTISLEMGAYLLVAIREGASFLCCARQGGVGKTALMGALLGLLPVTERVETLPSAAALATFENYAGKRRRCIVVHEIGSGAWYGYLWGPPVLRFTALAGDHTRIASTIHADTLDEVEEQFVQFGGSLRDVAAFDLVLFINTTGERVNRDRRRVITRILESPGKRPGAGGPDREDPVDENPGHFKTIFEHDPGIRMGDTPDARDFARGEPGRFSSHPDLGAARNLLERLLDDGVFRLEKVMERVQPFLSRGQGPVDQGANDGSVHRR